jgi:hypothetical protein
MHSALIFLGLAITKNENEEPDRAATHIQVYVGLFKPIEIFDLISRLRGMCNKLLSKPQNRPPKCERPGQIERPVLRLMKVCVRIAIDMDQNKR